MIADLTARIEIQLYTEVPNGSGSDRDNWLI